jgi:hypothetical protein
MSDTGLARYDAMCHAIATCYSVDEAKGIRDKARAIEVYALQAKNRDAERKAAEIRIRAERRCGQLLKESKQTGQRDAGRGGNRKAKSRSGAPTVKKLKDLGISKEQSSQWQQLANIHDDVFEGALSEACAKPSTEGILNTKIPKKEPTFDPSPGPRPFDTDAESRRHRELIELSFERCPLELWAQYKAQTQQQLAQMWEDENWLTAAGLFAKCAADANDVLEGKISAAEARKQTKELGRLQKQVGAKIKTEARAGHRFSGRQKAGATGAARADPRQPGDHETAVGGKNTYHYGTRSRPAGSRPREKVSRNLTTTMNFKRVLEGAAEHKAKSDKNKTESVRCVDLTDKARRFAKQIAEGKHPTLELNKLGNLRLKQPVEKLSEAERRTRAKFGKSSRARWAKVKAKRRPPLG